MLYPLSYGGDGPSVERLRASAETPGNRAGAGRGTRCAVCTGRLLQNNAGSGEAWSR
jgi:hypothetical protein